MVTVIAEIGTGHGGEVGRGCRLIDMAARCGADVAKFQYVVADEIIHPNTGTVALPGGEIPLYERFRQLEQPDSFYLRLKKHCEEAGISFLCTPFGIESARALRRMDCRALKIASPELNHLELLEEVASYGLPLYLSTGVSRLADIEAALEITGRESITLLHCVTAYPAPESDYNLRLIPLLGGITGVPVGVSDHSLDPSVVGSLAVCMGATAIEKHVTLSRSDSGLDDPIAQDEDGFRACVASIRRAERDGPAETLARLARDLGEQRVESVLGDGVKRLAPSEAANYTRTNRSLHAVEELAEGHVLSRGDFRALRTEKTLRPGLPPQFAGRIVGCRTSARIPAGEGIRLEDLVFRPATDFWFRVST